MEDWQSAHAHLEQAGPVVARYPLPWQASAVLADADAALGLNRLDLADAALQRLPKELDNRQMLAATLARARILAASRFGAAAELFAKVENGGDEKLAAAALFHHTNAALAAHAISPGQAIAQLEKLRFRWRGDKLELKTLRKLASLYFQKNQWRDGLKTLHIATQNFSGEDSARVAQDDMRALRQPVPQGRR